MPKLFAASILFVGLLAGCSGSQTTENSVTTTTTATANGVVREEVAATPAPVAAPAPVAIQTQPGPKGSQVSLNKVAVTGDIMTVALTYTGADCCSYAKVEEVSAIDDATSQRIGVLKDNAGKWMAAPLNNDGKEIRIDAARGPAQVWFKFPAPPAASKTVSITIPEVAPFDAVPVTR